MCKTAPSPFRRKAAMHRISMFVLLGFMLAACVGDREGISGWRQPYDEEPVYDYYYGEKGNPVDDDPIFSESSVLYGN